MTIDESKLKTAVDLTMASSGGRGISLWSRDGARVLRYFEHTIIGFSKGIAAADVLEPMVETAYPEIWNAVSDYIPPADGMQVQCPVCNEWYTPKYAVHNQKPKQAMPVLGDIDRDELKAVEIELDKRSNCLISVYNSRVSATMRYLSLTETKFTISKAAAGLLERGLAELYPAFSLESVESKINDLLNCDYDLRFEINPLTDLPVSDGSLHYRISKDNNYVDFGVSNGEIVAYTWDCPGEGRIFLEALEEYATKEGLNLTIPTVLNPKLENILKGNGYTMKEVPYLDGMCELWSKG